MTRRGFAGLALLAALLGCREAPPPATVAAPSTPPRAEAPAPSPGPTDPALDALAARAVYDDDFVRTTLYTWTTVEQLVELRATKRLLVADAETAGWSSPYHRALEAIPDDGSAQGTIAALLREGPELRRHRYAWPSPFATTMGLGARRYGDALIEIELAPEAWIGRFEPNAAAPLRFVEAATGAELSLDEVAAAPGRIAAIYHRNGPPGERLDFREYVVCNEAMVARWSIASADIRARVEAEIAMLEGLAAGTLAQLPRAAIAEPAAPSWASAPNNPTPLELWHASLAFDNARYRPGPRELRAIAATLAGLRDDGGGPLDHRTPRAP